MLSLKDRGGSADSVQTKLIKEGKARKVNGMEIIEIDED
jgi:hypothetical protein